MIKPANVLPIVLIPTLIIVSLILMCINLETIVLNYKVTVMPINIYLGDPALAGFFLVFILCKDPLQKKRAFYT